MLRHGNSTEYAAESSKIGQCGSFNGTNGALLLQRTAAANQLYEQNGRRDLPTLDSVRKLSRTNMADASAVMKEWRRLQTASAQTAVVAVPDRVQHAASVAVAALWAEAQELANESLNVAQAAWETERTEAEKQRVELSGAFDAQGAELESLRAKVTELQDAAIAKRRRQRGYTLTNQT